MGLKEGRRFPSSSSSLKNGLALNSWHCFLPINLDPELFYPLWHICKFRETKSKA